VYSTKFLFSKRNVETQFTLFRRLVGILNNQPNHVSNILEQIISYINKDIHKVTEINQQEIYIIYIT
jgi:hypothetical protein